MSYLPDEVIHKFIIERQKILVKQHGEIWLHLHNFLGGDQNWNGPHLPALYQALKDEFKDTPFYSIQFAHFAVGNTLQIGNANDDHKITMRNME